MKVAFGLKAHSGWAALVVVGRQEGKPVAVDRLRIDLVEEAWARQPYHAAEHLKSDAARKRVLLGIEQVHRSAVRALRAAVDREALRGNEVAACAVLVTDPMPKWSIEEILAVHFRMHKSEGVLFRTALRTAAEANDLKVIAIHEKQLMEQAERMLGRDASSLAAEVAALGKALGPPWGQDQKSAALAALATLGIS